MGHGVYRSDSYLKLSLSKRSAAQVEIGLYSVLIGLLVFNFTGKCCLALHGVIKND